MNSVDASNVIDMMSRVDDYRSFCYLRAVVGRHMRQMKLDKFPKHCRYVNEWDGDRDFELETKLAASTLKAELEAKYGKPRTLTVDDTGCGSQKICLIKRLKKLDTVISLFDAKKFVERYFATWI